MSWPVRFGKKTRCSQFFNRMEVSWVTFMGIFTWVQSNISNGWLWRRYSGRVERLAALASTPLLTSTSVLVDHILDLHFVRQTQKRPFWNCQFWTMYCDDDVQAKLASWLRWKTNPCSSLNPQLEGGKREGCIQLLKHYINDVLPALSTASCCPSIWPGCRRRCCYLDFLQMCPGQRKRPALLPNLLLAGNIVGCKLRVWKSWGKPQLDAARQC